MPLQKPPPEPHAADRQVSAAPLAGTTMACVESEDAPRPAVPPSQAFHGKRAGDLEHVGVPKPWASPSIGKEARQVELGPHSLALLCRIATALEEQISGRELPDSELLDSMRATQSVDTHSGLPEDRLGVLEKVVAEVRDLVKAQRATEKVKTFYSTIEVAERLELSPWTIRNCCNKGRIRAEKGPDGNWRVPHEELVQIERNGLPDQSD